MLLIFGIRATKILWGELSTFAALEKALRSQRHLPISDWHSAHQQIIVIGTPTIYTHTLDCEFTDLKVSENYATINMTMDQVP